MKYGRWNLKLFLILNTCMSVFFALLYFGILKKCFNGDTIPGFLLQMLGILVIFILNLTIYKGLGRIEAFLGKYKKIILGIFLLLFLGLQIYFGNILRVVPLYDFSSVYDGAVDWIVTGDFANFIRRMF